MRKDGRLKEFSKPIPRLAFLCDTTIQVFGRCSGCSAGSGCHFEGPYTRSCPEASALQQQLELIFQCSTVVVECTFCAIGMTEAESEQQAKSRGHIAWSELRPVVESHPEIEFILVHFSERYSDDEIRLFFQTASSAGGCVANVLLWLDEGLSKA
eukprot:gb/GFBE01048804.1/.p1 GENE.gb/GFBE01048804.1/~~gb/GFBE01048804.1/.p1  ORF type:complete len:155 (+),score=26.03 gb/GFBE01048804.1/:1-465(+)